MRKNRMLMYAIGFLQGMIFYGPIATLYRQAQGVSVFQITLIESISLALCIMLEIPWGVIADRIGYRSTMIFCCCLYFVSKIVFWKARGFGGFLAERIMLSVVLAGISGVDSSILYLSGDGPDSQKAFGIYNSMSMGGLVIAAFVFSMFVGDDYALAGFLTVISYGIAAGLSFGLSEVKHKKEGCTHPEQFKIIVKETLNNKNLLLFLTAAAFLSESHQTITVFLNQLQYERCGLGNSVIGYIYIAATMIGMCGVWSAAITRKAGRFLSIVLFCGSAVLSCVMLAFTQDAVLSVSGIFILRISNSFFEPFQMELQNRQIRTENRATALSINSMYTDCIAIGTNLIFGILSEIGLSLAFLFGAGICGLSLFLLAGWHKRTNCS